MCDHPLESLIEWVGLNPAPGGLCPLPEGSNSSVLCFYNQYVNGDATGLKDSEGNTIPATSTIGLDTNTVCNAYGPPQIPFSNLLSPSNLCSTNDQGCWSGVGNACCNSPLSFISVSSLSGQSPTSANIQALCQQGKCAPCASPYIPLVSGSLNLGSSSAYLYNCGATPPITLNVTNSLNVCENFVGRDQITCSSQNSNQILTNFCLTSVYGCSLLMYNVVSPQSSTGWISSSTSSFNLTIPFGGEVQFIAFALGAVNYGEPTDSLGPYWVSFTYDQLQNATSPNITFSGGSIASDFSLKIRFANQIIYSSNFTSPRTSDGGQPVYYTQNLPNTNYYPFGSWD